MSFDAPPNVRGATLAEAFRAGRRSERAFRQKARVAQRMPATRSKKREERALQAIHLLRLAIFWRGLAEDYESENPQALVERLEDAATIEARWRESALRVRLAAQDGATAPDLQHTAVDTALKPAPGERGLPWRPAANMAHPQASGEAE